MIGLFCFALAVLEPPFKSKLRLEAENAVVRHQLIVLRRRLHGRVRLTDQAAQTILAGWRRTSGWSSATRATPRARGTASTPIALQDKTITI